MAMLFQQSVYNIPYMFLFQETHKAAMNNVENSSKQSLDDLEHKHQVRHLVKLEY